MTALACFCLLPGCSACAASKDAAPSSRCSCLMADCADCAVPARGQKRKRSDFAPSGKLLAAAAVLACMCLPPTCQPCAEGNGVLPVPRALRLRLPGAFPDEPLLSLEQPDCSIMWLLAAVASWMQATGGWTSRLSYCQFGMPLRKTTRIHFSSDFGFAVLDRMCSSRQDGHKHEQLNGWEANAFRTSKASAYPRLLAKAWAAAVDAWWVQHGARSGLPRRALELFAGSGHLAQGVDLAGHAALNELAPVRGSSAAPESEDSDSNVDTSDSESESSDASGSNVGGWQQGRRVFRRMREWQKMLRKLRRCFKWGQGRICWFQAFREAGFKKPAALLCQLSSRKIVYSGKYLRQGLDHLYVRFLAMRKQHASLAARAQKASMPQNVAPAAKARPFSAGPGVDVDLDMCLLGLLTNAPSQSAASGAQRAKRVKTQQSTRYRAKMETIEKNAEVMCSSRHVFHVLAVTEGLTEYFAAAEFVQSSTQLYFPVFARTVAVQDYLREASGKVLAAPEAPPQRTATLCFRCDVCGLLLLSRNLRRDHVRHAHSAALRADPQVLSPTARSASLAKPVEEYDTWPANSFATILARVSVLGVLWQFVCPRHQGGPALDGALSEHTWVCYARLLLAPHRGEPRRQKVFENAVQEAKDFFGTLRDKYCEKVIRAPGIHFPWDVLVAATECFALETFLSMPDPGPPPANGSLGDAFWKPLTKSFRAMAQWAIRRWGHVVAFPPIQDLQAQYIELIRAMWVCGARHQQRDCSQPWPAHSATVAIIDGGGQCVVKPTWINGPWDVLAPADTVTLSKHARPVTLVGARGVVTEVCRRLNWKQLWQLVHTEDRWVPAACKHAFWLFHAFGSLAGSEAVGNLLKHYVGKSRASFAAKWRKKSIYDWPLWLGRIVAEIHGSTEQHRSESGHSKLCARLAVWGKSLACQGLLPGVIKQLYPDVLMRGCFVSVRFNFATPRANELMRLVETVCLVQAAKEPSDRIASTYSDNLKDAWNTASYANRFNLHVTQQHGKADTNPLIAVQVCIPVVCEVIASTTPHWFAAGDFVTVCAYPQQEVQKFIFDGNEPFQDVPQAFFHYAAATSGGKDIVWDLQGCREQNSGTYLLVDPVVRRRPPATVRNLFFATVGNERGLGKVSPNPKQIDLLHPKCTRLCETFDPERLAAYGKGAGFACFQ
ncbi:unnamed protein product [Polarella glacialis]|uniref:Alpha-type protein kinase domain-containing protein n=1 Tax=Polarella glacialis TaxID=89957 RepID=A0A813ITJ6_POLGL|nr:unnamed protein product [Polarella glacialis]